MKRLVPALVLALLPSLLLADSSTVRQSPFRLLLYAGLAGGHLGYGWNNSGWPPGPWARFSSYHIVPVGLGVQWRDFGVLLSVNPAEGYPWGFAGMYAGSPSRQAAYVQVVYGATNEWTTARPVLYAYANVEELPFRKYSQPHVGIGAKWRYYVLSPDVRVSWHRVTSPERVWPPYQYDYINAAVGLELGGLWALRLWGCNSIAREVVRRRPDPNWL
jgi:hypothetical protein